MKIFRLLNTEDTDVADVYAGTLAEIKEPVRALAAHDRKNRVVEELEVQTDKAGVIAMLNGSPITKLTRSFDITPRGGLKELV